MFNIDLAIKFGSNEIIMYRKGVGIIAKEPAFLAVENTTGKPKVRAIGKEAERLLHAKSSNVEVYQPIENSEIIDEKMATLLISEILNKVLVDKFLLTNLTALVAVPCALNEAQLRILKRVLNASGVNRVKFVQNSVCALENLQIDPHSFVCVVDIGKYITDISILNKHNFQFGRMYFIGGAQMDKSITTFIQDNHNLEVSDITSEEVKNEVASLYDRDLYKTEYIGLSPDNKFIKNEISANEVRVAILNVYDSIFELINQVLNEQPKDVLKDIYSNGIVFVGGASAIAGFYEYAKKKLDFPIIVPENVKDYVIIGAGKLLSAEEDFLQIKF